jgi:hypothetical protein
MHVLKMSESATMSTKYGQEAPCCNQRAPMEKSRPPYPSGSIASGKCCGILIVVSFPLQHSSNTIVGFHATGSQCYTLSVCFHSPVICSDFYNKPGCSTLHPGISGDPTATGFKVVGPSRMSRNIPHMDTTAILRTLRTWDGDPG